MEISLEIYEHSEGGYAYEVKYQNEKGESNEEGGIHTDNEGFDIAVEKGIDLVNEIMERIND